MKRSSHLLQHSLTSALLALTGILAYAMLHDSPVTGGAAQDASPRPGTQLHLQSAVWRGHDQTLVIAIRRGCHFCEASMPFYHRLSQLAAQHTITVPIILGSPDDAYTTKFLEKSQHLELETLPPTPLRDLGVDGTPTALLVDRNGTVVHSWSGQLNRSEEEHLISMLTRP